MFWHANAAIGNHQFMNGQQQGFNHGQMMGNQQQQMPAGQQMPPHSTGFNGNGNAQMSAQAGGTVSFPIGQFQVTLGFPNNLGSSSQQQQQQAYDGNSVAFYGNSYDPKQHGQSSQMAPPVGMNGHGQLQQQQNVFGNAQQMGQQQLYGNNNGAIGNVNDAQSQQMQIQQFTPNGVQQMQPFHAPPPPAFDPMTMLQQQQEQQSQQLQKLDQPQLQQSAWPNTQMDAKNLSNNPFLAFGQLACNVVPFISDGFEQQNRTQREQIWANRDVGLDRGFSERYKAKLMANAATNIATAQMMQQTQWMGQQMGLQQAQLQAQTTALIQQGAQQTALQLGQYQMQMARDENATKVLLANNNNETQKWVANTNLKIEEARAEGNSNVAQIYAKSNETCVKLMCDLNLKLAQQK